MPGTILDSPGPGYVFVEGEYGGVWTDLRIVEGKPDNPYNQAARIRKVRQPLQGLEDSSGRAWGRDYNARKRGAPDELGYVWSMGYNNLVGRYTQGNLFPELSGSSINRKKHDKEFSATDNDIIAMARKAEIQYVRSGHSGICEYEGCRVHVSWLVETVIAEVEQGNRAIALRLALWLSESLRKLPRALSYGVHVLSARSRAKIKDKATAFFRACPGNRVFATLTFISAVDDRTAVAILNSFLTQMRKKFPGLQYFWVAERQTGDRNDSRGVEKEATGNVHFHMILNKRLPVGRWNAMWVLAQYNAGLVAHTDYGDEISKSDIMNLYAADQRENFSGGRSKRGKKISRIQEVLNPFDIKPVKSIGGLSSYLTKYITKQQKDQPFGCAAWHCSRRVSRLFTRQVVGPSAFSYMKSFANFGVDRSTGEVYAEPVTITCGNGFATMVYVYNKTAPLRYIKRMEMVNKWILEGHEVDRVPMLDDALYRKILVCKS